MSIEVLLPEPYSTSAHFVRKWILVKWALELRKARRRNLITKEQSETMVTILDSGWTLAAIPAHFGIDVKDFEQAIVGQVKSERNQVDE